MIALQESENHPYLDGKVGLNDLTATNEGRCLLRRWRQLSYLAFGLLLLMSVILATCVLLMSARQQLGAQLQSQLETMRAEYGHRVDDLHKSMALWQRKQAALQQWRLDWQTSQVPYGYTLLAQQLAGQTHGRVERLTWDGRQLHLFLRSNRDWHLIRRALQHLPRARLVKLERSNEDQVAVGWIRYQVVLDVMEWE